MNKKNVLIFSLSLIVASGLQGKDNTDQIKAEYYFSHMAFSKAIVYYEKILEKGDDAQVFNRLGDCYRLTGNVPQAASCYARVVAMNKVTDALRLKYAKVLMQLQQYDSAATLLRVYVANNPTDRRAVNMAKGCELAPTHLRAIPKGQPVLLAFNTDRSEMAPALWNGNLVFASDSAVSVRKKRTDWTGAACYNLYSAACDENGNCGTNYVSAGKTGRWNIEWHDGPATFNAAGDTMYFTRTRYNDKLLFRGAVPNGDSVVVLEIMMATGYDPNTSTFKNVHPMPFNRANYSVAYPTISLDGNTFIFSSTMNGSGSDLYMSKRNKRGKWMQPINLGPNINTEGEEVFPYLVNDTTLIFASDGHPGLGGLDIYTSSWDQNTGTFLPPVAMGIPVNSSYDDMSMAISAEGNGYFSSNRPANAAGDNIYFYRKR